MSKEYPCDHGPCPFIGEHETTNRMYFCRDFCGMGVDENEYPEEFDVDEEDDDYYFEDCDDYYCDDDTGYDPYAGCYTDDC